MNHPAKPRDRDFFRWTSKSVQRALLGALHRAHANAQKGWSQGSLYRDSKGRACASSDSGIASYCMLGAVAEAVDNSEVDGNALGYEVRRVLRAAIVSYLQATPDCLQRASDAGIPIDQMLEAGCIASFNDSEATSWPDIDEVFKTAIEHAKEHLSNEHRN